MKKSLVLSGALAFTLIPSLSVAENLSPKKIQATQVINKLGSDFNDQILIANKVVDISDEDLPFRLKCPNLNGDLLIKKNKSNKFVVKGLRKDNWFNRYFKRVEIKKFHKGLDFNEALKVFKKTYKDRCGIY